MSRLQALVIAGLIFLVVLVLGLAAIGEGDQTPAIPHMARYTKVQ